MSSEEEEVVTSDGTVLAKKSRNIFWATSQYLLSINSKIINVFIIFDISISILSEFKFNVILLGDILRLGFRNTELVTN